MNPQALLQTLQRWRDRSWLRDLDVALARFIVETDPTVPTSLVLAAALLAHMEGRGHTGLRLDGLDAMCAQGGADEAERRWPDPAALGWPAPALGALREVLRGTWPVGDSARRRQWDALDALDALDAVDEVAVAETGDDGGGVSPLVWCEPLLQLRRHWRAETEVARQVLQRAAALPELAEDPAAGPDQGAAAGASVWQGEPAALLDLLFAPPPPPGEAQAAEGQRHACAVALSGRLTLITGGPGTGKTYTAARVLVALQALRGARPPLRVALAAPTGKAAARLRQAMSEALQDLGERLGDRLNLGTWSGQIGPGRTLHALLGTQPGTRRWRHTATNPLPVDLLLVDEASMVHLELMAHLLQALPPQARLVLLGDRDQLASVEPGAVMAELCRHGSAEHSGDAEVDKRVVAEHVPPAAAPQSASFTSPLAQRTVVLRHSHRFSGPIAELARCVNRGDAAGALGLLREAEAALSWVSLQGRERGASRPAALSGPSHPQAQAWDAAQGYRDWVQRLLLRPNSTRPQSEAAWIGEVLERFDDFRVLCALREGPHGVAGLNRTIEGALTPLGLQASGPPWYEGRPVMVTRNEPALGLFNGDVGIVLRGVGVDQPLRAHFATADGLRSVPVGQLPPVETAFAMTIHKSQGSEFGHVALVLPDTDTPVLTREALYTGITRARRQLTLVADDAQVLVRAIGSRTQRVSGLGQRLASLGMG